MHVSSKLRTGKLFKNIEDVLAMTALPLLDVWMSHGDKVSDIPQGFITVARTETCPHAAMANEEKKFYGVQFHHQK